MTEMELRLRSLAAGVWLVQWRVDDVLPGDCLAVDAAVAEARWVAVADVLVCGRAGDVVAALEIARSNLETHTGCALCAVPLSGGLLQLLARDSQQSVLASAGIRGAAAAYVAWVSGGPLPAAESSAAMRASNSSAAGSPASA